jgi:hypothetical protein
MHLHNCITTLTQCIYTIASIDKKIGITQKFTTGSAAVHQQVKAIHEKFEVTEKTCTAKQKINIASYAIVKNMYDLIEATWGHWGICQQPKQIKNWEILQNENTKHKPQKCFTQVGWKANSQDIKTGNLSIA